MYMYRAREGFSWAASDCMHAVIRRVSVNTAYSAIHCMERVNPRLVSPRRWIVACRLDVTKTDCSVSLAVIAHRSCN